MRRLILVLPILMLLPVAFTCGCSSGVSTSRGRTAVGRLIKICILAVALFASCSDREAMSIMSDADRMLDSRPDSALSIIRNIDVASLRTEEARARHSLLLTMSLLKTNPGAVSDSLFAPARDFYGGNEKPSRESMLAHFANAALWDMSDSVVLAAEEYERVIALYSNENDSLYKGLANLNIGAILINEGYPEKAYDYILSSKEAIMSSGDTAKIINYHILMCQCLTGKVNPEGAEREIREALSFSRQSGFNDRELKLKASLAHTISMQGRHPEAVCLFDSLFASGMRLQEDCLFSYAWSLVNVGKTEEARKMIEPFRDSGSPTKNARYFYLMSESMAAEGNHRDAIEMKNLYDHSQHKVAETRRASMLENRLDNIRATMREEALIQAREEKDLKNKSYIAGGAVAVMLVVIFGMAMWEYVVKYEKAKREHKEKESGLYVRIRELEVEGEEKNALILAQSRQIEVMTNQKDRLSKDRNKINKEIRRLKELIGTEADITANLQELEERKARISSDMGNIESDLKSKRQKMRDMFYSYHGKVSEFCKNPPATAAEMAAFEIEREKRLSPYRDREYIESLRREINLFTGDFLTRISTRLKLSENLVTTAVYDICGFDYICMGILFRIDPGNAATRRTRLKAKLKALEGDDLAICADIMNIMS